MTSYRFSALSRIEPDLYLPNIIGGRVNCIGGRVNCINSIDHLTPVQLYLSILTYPNPKLV